ncbi:hypothetical protein AAKU64_003714 [Undibacterium sp. GrIS 1.8]|uniref:hypothetical protein n=1 Tax=Undibacterium sp. GrIS 1.8 TaxID=3143934 RepID=UPI003395C7D6
MLKRLAMALSILMTCGTVMAEPGYYFVSVYDNKDQKSVDFRYWTTNFPGRGQTIWPELGFGYGVTSRWYTEIYASYIGSSRSDLKLDSWNWQNDYLLTQGQYPVDVALHTNLTRGHDSDEGYTLELGPAMQTDFGRLQVNGNVFLERTYRSVDGGATQMKYQWQTKYRWKPMLELGVQGFGELGDWDHWASRDQQSHRAGPALFGSVPVGRESSIKYQAAYLIGSIYGRHGYMFTSRIQYIF